MSEALENTIMVEDLDDATANFDNISDRVSFKNRELFFG